VEAAESCASGCTVIGVSASEATVWHVACGMWHVACGMWHVACQISSGLTLPTLNAGDKTSEACRTHAEHCIQHDGQIPDDLSKVVKSLRSCRIVT
jgi:hypothetical protein